MARVVVARLGAVRAAGREGGGKAGDKGGSQGTNAREYGSSKRHGVREDAARISHCHNCSRRSHAACFIVTYRILEDVLSRCSNVAMLKSSPLIFVYSNVSMNCDKLAV